MKNIALSSVLVILGTLFQVHGQCSQEVIRKHIAEIANTISGEVGVSALLYECNEHIDFNGAMLFPMASTYKIAIAIHTLALVEKGLLHLHDKVPLTRCDVRQDSSIINARFFQGETSISVKDLLIAMMQMSDNTATDALLKIPYNTPANITEYLQKSGINAMAISRTVHHMIVDFYSMPRNEDCAVIEDFNRHVDLDDVPQPRETEERFYHDTARDSATPCAMTELLALFLKEQLVAKSNMMFLLDIMEGCKTGQNRIKGLLPIGTKVAHKTGSIAGICNDVGIVTLPSGEHLILAIFINGSTSPRPERERVIASIAKLLYDYWTAEAIGSC